MDISITDAAVIYHVSPSDLNGHIYTVTCRIAKPDPAGQRLSLPVWAPGSYLLREFSRHVLSLTATDDDGEVSLRKLDKAKWQAEPTRGALVFRAEIYANDLSVRGAFLDRGHGFINGVCLFLRAEGLADQTCALQLDAPGGVSDWKLATAMRRTSGAEHEFGAFEAASYDELVDQPILMGPLITESFEVLGVPHEFALVGCDDVDVKRITQDIRKICRGHANLFGGELPMQRYVFLTTALNKGYGGLEHSDSTALICCRSDLPRIGEAGQKSGYRKFLGLCSHEYFHLWNVKRIRPKGLQPYDFERENYTRQLWLFEGITAYYDDLMLVRSGLISPTNYLELLGRSFTRVYRSVGRRKQTLEDASFDAWIKFYRQDENAPNALVSYYTKGAMVALALDLELRLRSDGKLCLDDVMLAFWKEYGQAAEGVPQGAFERLAEEVSGLRLEEFFEQNLRGTVDPPVGILLAQFGVRLSLRAAETLIDQGGTAGVREDRPLPWLGIKTRIDSGRVVVANVLIDGPAAEAGVSAKDELLALKGLRITPENFQNLMDTLTLGEPVALDIFRRDDLHRMNIVPTRPPRDTAYLSLEPESDVESLARQAAWLGV